MIKKVSFIIIASGLMLSACSNNHEGKEHANNQQHEDHMQRKDTQQLPDNMKQTKDGEFKKGDKVTITMGHMAGMKNAKGTVKGAYKTHAYVVSYKPTNGKKEVENHKWVVNEELADAPQKGFEKGDTAKLKADHMPGMKGAKATIDNVKHTTVYIVDYKSTDNGKLVKNHKWMTADELKSR